MIMTAFMWIVDGVLWVISLGFVVCTGLFITGFFSEALKWLKKERYDEEALFVFFGVSFLSTILTAGSIYAALAMLRNLL